MKILIILIAMLAAVAGSLHTYHQRNLLIQATLYAEAFNLTAHVKLRVSDYFLREGVMPHDNSQAGLPPAKSIYGTSVQRVAINRGGVLLVDFEEEIGRQSLTFTPEVSPISGLLSWHCSSDSIDPDVLNKLRPGCSHLSSTPESQLMHAIANRSLDRVRDLLASGARADAVVSGNTPLMLAAKVGHLPVVEALLQAGAAVDNSGIGSERRTPLMVAITSNQAEVAAALLAQGASVTHTDYKGMSALDHAAATDRRLNGERYVLMTSARLNPRFAGTPEQPVHRESAEARHVRLSGLYGELTQAARDCHVQRLSSLLRQESDLDTGTLVAGKPLNRHTRKPQCTQDLRAFIQGKTSYQLALQARMATSLMSCDQRQADALLRDNPDLDVMLAQPEQASVFFQAVAHGCTDILSMMIRDRELAGTLRGDSLIQAMQSAPQQATVSVIGTLIAARADVDGADQQGQTPLGAAIALEQPVVAKYLIDAGANVNARTLNGSSPLIEASKKGYVHLVSQLVESGAEVNAKDALGRTALLVAVAANQNRLVESLVRAGADPRVKDANGIDARILAQSRDLRQISRQLTASNEY